MRSSDPGIAALLDKLLAGDWLERPDMRARFGERFASRPRFGPLRTALHWLRYQRRRLRS